MIRFRSRLLPRALSVAVPCFLAVAALGATERDAHALGPVDVEVGARVGFGTNPDANGPNPFGFGIGGRAGVTLFHHLYAGLSAIHYFGNSTDLAGPGTPAGVFNVGSVSYSSTLLGVEAGYSITAVPLLTLRPQLGVGNAAFSFGDASQSHLYLEPGFVALVTLGLVYVGADATVLVVPSIDQGGTAGTHTYSAFTLHGQIGLRF